MISGSSGLRFEEKQKGLVISIRDTSIEGAYNYTIEMSVKGHSSKTYKSGTLRLTRTAASDLGLTQAKFVTATKLDSFNITVYRDQEP